MEMKGICRGLFSGGQPGTFIPDQLFDLSPVIPAKIPGAEGKKEKRKKKGMLPT